MERRTVMKKLLVLAVCLLIVAGCAYSKRSRGTTARSGVEIGDEWLNVEISDSERETINRYFYNHPQKVTKYKTLPPGLQKNAARGQALPPGWQMKIARGEVLDADVYRHATYLPYDLVRTLPPAPEGTVFIKVEGKIIRLYEATRTILDVFDIGQ
jgi:hypothetical protein